MDARTVPATRQVAAALAVQRQEPVHEIVRIRLAEKVPLALEHSWFPAQVFPDLLSQPLTGSLYRLLTRHYRQRPHTAVEYLEPASVTAVQAQQLGIEPGVAVMRIERTAHTAAGLAVEYATDLFRPDRIRISVRSQLDRGPGREGLDVDSRPAWSSRLDVCRYGNMIRPWHEQRRRPTSSTRSPSSSAGRSCCCSGRVRGRSTSWPTSWG